MLSSVESTPEAVVPDLRIVPTKAVVPHEEHDNQRSGPLVERIRQAGVWLNPPIVAPLDATRYVLLDGANRHYCIEVLGYPYILVQVVNYESVQVQLETWHHVISGISWFTFLKKVLHQVRSTDHLYVQSTDLLSARAALASREVLAYTVLRDDRAYTIRSDEHSIQGRTDALRAMVNTYKSTGVLNRINTDVLSAAHQMYPNAVAILVFPRFQPAEIMVAARDKALLPPGITRHIIYGRAMRLNYPLEEFTENGDSLAVKNDKLQQWIQQRTAQKSVRYYAESTYLYDE